MKLPGATVRTVMTFLAKFRSCGDSSFSKGLKVRIIMLEDLKLWVNDLQGLKVSRSELMTGGGWMACIPSEAEISAVSTFFCSNRVFICQCRVFICKEQQLLTFCIILSICS